MFLDGVLLQVFVLDMFLENLLGNFGDLLFGVSAMVNIADLVKRV